VTEMNPIATHPISVIGLGNVFLGDDGFGPLAVETFRSQFMCGPEVEVLDLGTPGLRAVSVFCEDDFTSSRACLRITGHDPGLWDTLTHLRIADCGPSELIVIGTAPESCIFGDGPSDAMLRLAAEAAESIAQLLSRRGVLCNRRHVAPHPNLWWLPLSSTEDPNLQQVSEE